MNRKTYPTLILAALMIAGCSGAPTEEDTSTSQGEALSSADDPSEDDDDADVNVDVDVVLKHRAAYKLTLSSYDGTTLVGTARNGTTVTTATTAATKYRAAKTERFQPGDPCRTLALQYNASLTGNLDFPTSQAISSLAAQSCNARIHLVRQTGAVRAFRVIP